MSQRSRFFDSVAGDRVYTSDAWAQVVAGLTSDGVVTGQGNELAVSESSPPAMSVRVNTGVAFVLGYYFEVYGAQETLAITAAHATLPRIDRIVVRRNLTGRTSELAVVDGTPGASPTAPALTQNTSGTYEIPLATVAVGAAVTSIVNANITDARGTRAMDPALSAALNGTTGHAHDGTNGGGPTIAYSAITGKPSSFTPSAHTHADAGTGGTVAYSVLTGKPSSFAPSDHAHTATPGDGGLVSYGSLTGKPSSFTAAAHALDPASGFHTGTLPYSNLSSVPSTFAPSAHKTSHQDGGTDEIGIDWSQIISGKPSTFAPTAHASAHADGSSDPVTVTYAQITGKPNIGLISDNVAGDSGVTIYVQTTTPTGVDGDVWIKG